MISGELSVMTRGAQRMPQRSASSWDLLILQVSASVLHMVFLRRNRQVNYVLT